MAKVLKNLSVALVGVFLSLLVFAAPASAIANPDSISIEDVYVFDDVLEFGDVLVYMRYNVVYASEPSEDSDDAFLMAIYDTDGSTLMTGCVRPLNYYQHNIISIYLDASSNVLTWGEAYRVRVMGSPAVFANLTESINMRTRVLAEGDYRDAEDLGDVIIAQAEILEADWGTTLLTATDRLNEVGAYYFNKAIPGLPSMLTGVYDITSTQFTYTRNTSLTQAGINKSLERLPTSLNSAIHGMDQMLGITNDNFGGFGWVLFAGLIVGSVIYAASQRPDIAVLAGGMGSVGLGAYVGVSEGNVMLFLMAVGTLIVVLFAVEFFIPRYG